MKENLWLILLGSILVNNFVMSRFYGTCPFLGVSKKTETAFGMGMAVTFVITVASLATYFVRQLLVALELEYLQTIAFILVIAVFGILPQLGMKGPFENFQNPLAGLFEGGKNAAANAALDVSGLKSKAESALRGNTDRIAEATGMSSSQVDAAIDALDIQSWEVTNLPEGAEKTGSANVSYSGTDATITTYDDPSVVTVTAMGQDITLAVPDSAQTYLPFLSYLG